MWPGLQGLPQSSVHEDLQAVKGRCFLCWTSELTACYRLRAAHHVCILLMSLARWAFYLNSSFSSTGFSLEGISADSSDDLFLIFFLPLHFNTRYNFNLRHKESHSEVFCPFEISIAIAEHSDTESPQSSAVLKKLPKVVSLQWHGDSHKIFAGSQGWLFIFFVCLEMNLSCFNWRTNTYSLHILYFLLD